MRLTWICALSAMHCATAWPAISYEFRAVDGTTVAAELGELQVAENRGKASTHTLRLKYVRFPATTPTPGSPIVYLAGGPGGSGIEAARGQRFAMFMAF